METHAHRRTVQLGIGNLHTVPTAMLFDRSVTSRLSRNEHLAGNVQGNPFPLKPEDIVYKVTFLVRYPVRGFLVRVFPGLKSLLTPLGVKSIEVTKEQFMSLEGYAPISRPR